MKRNPFTFAAQAKGPFVVLKRVGAITQRYSITPKKMMHSLGVLIDLLQQFNCSASFPLTGVVLKRNPKIITELLDRHIELLVHGYFHVDYTQIDPVQRLAEFNQARQLFKTMGIDAVGFRSPYLRRDTSLDQTVELAGFSYVSNLTILWDTPHIDAANQTEGYKSYQRAVNFYKPKFSNQHLALPRLIGNLVDVPVSLPDDEMLVDRLNDKSGVLVEKIWKHIFLQTYSRGELFTVQLHPERTLLCVNALAALLSETQNLTPSVWIARLDEIAAWWRKRTEAKVETKCCGDDLWQISAVAPSGTMLLTKNVDLLEPSDPWFMDWRLVKGTTCHTKSKLLPIIGLSAACPPAMISFLQQQGFIIQIDTESDKYSIYFNQTHFSERDERPLMLELEKSQMPLVKLSRWPNAARSVISITGDIDALTLKDYGLRFLGL